MHLFFTQLPSPRSNQLMSFWMRNRLVNPWVGLLLRSPLHPLVSRSLLLVVYNGKRSGRQNAVPAQYVENDDEMLVLVGSPEKKQWWRNLCPEAPVRVLRRGRWIDAVACVLDDDVDALAFRLNLYFKRFPRAASYCGVPRDRAGNVDPAGVTELAARAVVVIFRTRDAIDENVCGDTDSALCKKTSARTQIAWLLGAAGAGFAAAAIFAALLRLPRNLFLLPYAVVSAAFLYAYFRSSAVDLAEHFRHKPLLGVLGAAVGGALVVSNVLSQPASRSPEGWELILAVLWLGVVYGVLDALLLSVMPVVAARLTFAQAGLTTKPSGQVFAALFALAASLAVTAAYHLGYPEFRGPQVAGPLIGNAILTAAYLLTRSPLSATLAHVAMHVASVIHGIETTVQLPPHY